ncbi:MAG: hypothetical protein ACQEUT_09610 [Bacillota bacterium]
MNSDIKFLFEKLESKDKGEQYDAFQEIMAMTTSEVDWSYEIWDDLVKDLRHKDNHKRSRAAQFLSHLAISDRDNRMEVVFPALWKVTYDEKFVTARHALQAVWRVGLAGARQRELVLSHLVDRFKSCKQEKNHTLIRYDIIKDLRQLYDETWEEHIKQMAQNLITLEEDQKYRMKYEGVWKNS